MCTSVCLKALGNMTTGALLIHFVFCIADVIITCITYAFKTRKFWFGHQKEKKKKDI